MTTAVYILLLVTAQRIAELHIARRNTARLMARGAVEVAPEHYPAIVALHASWLAGLWLLGHDTEPDPSWTAVYLVLQGLRAWTMLTLGPRWTTRIIVLPGEPLVRSGPYRWLHHPNYAVVMGEIAVLPLALDLPIFAFLFSLLNTAVLMIRIRAEEEALRELCGFPRAGR